MMFCRVLDIRCEVLEQTSSMCFWLKVLIIGRPQFVKRTPFSTYLVIRFVSEIASLIVLLRSVTL